MSASVYKVLVDSVDVTSRFHPLLISLTVKLDDDGTADEATIELDDTDGQVGLPRMGAAIVIDLGTVDTGAAPVFTGFVDTAHSGGATRSGGSRARGRTMTILAKSADFLSALKERQQASKDNCTLSDAAQAWGQMAGLSAVKIDAALASIHRDYWGIHNESFPAWAERIAHQIGATFKIFGTVGVFVPRIGGTSASGAALTEVKVAWSDNLIEWSIAPVLSRPQYGTFATRWYDPRAAEWKFETADAKGLGIHTHRNVWKAPSQDQAKQQSGGNQVEADRESGGGDSVLILGDVTAQPAAKCVVSGIRPGVDGTYLISEVIHTLNRSQGFVTRLTLKQPSDGAGVDSRVSDPTNGTPVTTPQGSGPIGSA